MLPVGLFSPDPSSEAGWHNRFSAELLDGIAEAVLTPDPAARGDAICQLLEEVVACVAWMNTGLVDGELASLGHVLDEAIAHRAWLAGARSAESQTSVSQAS